VNRTGSTKKPEKLKEKKSLNREIRHGREEDEEGMNMMEILDLICAF